MQEGLHGDGEGVWQCKRINKLHATGKDCCANQLSWAMEEYRKSRSDPDAYGVPLGSEYTGLWFVNHAHNGESLSVIVYFLIFSLLSKLVN